MSTDAISAISPALSQAQTAAAVQTAVLRKTLDVQTQAAQGMVALIPDPPLATEGSVGTQLNTFA